MEQLRAEILTERRAVLERNRAFMLRALTVGLGVAAIVHNEILGDPVLWSLKNLVSAVAVVAVLRPSTRTFLALLAAELTSIAISYPKIVNHAVVIGILATAVLAYAAWQALLGDRGALKEGRLYGAIAPGARVALLGTYAFAAFAKLNEGFFEGDTSCATSIYNDIVDAVKVLPTSDLFQMPLAYGTVAIEIAIPVLLVFRRTRLAGLALGTAFHLALIFGGYAPFTAAAFAFYMGIFLPDDMLDRLRELGRQRPPLAQFAATVRRLAASGWTLALALGAWVITSLANTETGLDPVIDRGFQFLTFLFGAALALVAIAALRTGRSPRIPADTLRLPHPGWIVGLVGVVLIGLSPYVGLKTTAAFTMYSNLRTEGDQWNHLVLPESMQVFGFQDDLVTIVRTDDPDLAKRADAGDQLVWFAFTEHRRSHPEYAVEITRGDEVIALAPGQGVEGLDAPPHALAKFVTFRNVSTTNACQH